MAASLRVGASIPFRASISAFTFLMASPYSSHFSLFLATAVCDALSTSISFSIRFTVMPVVSCAASSGLLNPALSSLIRLVASSKPFTIFSSCSSSPNSGLQPRICWRSWFLAVASVLTDCPEISCNTKSVDLMTPMSLPISCSVASISVSISFKVLERNDCGISFPDAFIFSYSARSFSIFSVISTTLLLACVFSKISLTLCSRSCILLAIIYLVFIKVTA